MQIVPQIFEKNTTQNWPEYSISSENFNIFPGKGP